MNFKFNKREIERNVSHWLDMHDDRYGGLTPIEECEDINSDYMYVLLEPPVIDLSIRFIWVLIYKPSMKIVEMGEGRVSHVAQIEAINEMRDNIKEEKIIMKDKAMARLEIEGWLTKEQQ